MIKKEKGMKDELLTYQERTGKKHLIIVENITLCHYQLIKSRRNESDSIQGIDISMYLSNTYSSFNISKFLLVKKIIIIIRPLINSCKYNFISHYILKFLYIGRTFSEKEEIYTKLEIPCHSVRSNSESE